MKLHSVIFVTCFFSLSFVAEYSYADTIDTLNGATTPLWSLGQFGEGASYYTAATVGQTFRLNTGDDTILNSISFMLQDYHPENGDPTMVHVPDGYSSDFVDFALYLYEWDGTKAFGSSLFSGSELSTTSTGSWNNYGYDEWELFTVDLGSVTLEVNKDYVFFISSSQYFDGAVGAANVGIGPAASYENGNFVFARNYDQFGALLTDTWYYNSIDNIMPADLAFTMKLSSAGSGDVGVATVPEPATMLLFGTGLVGLVGARIRRKK